MSCPARRPASTSSSWRSRAARPRPPAATVQTTAGGDFAPTCGRPETRSTPCRPAPRPARSECRCGAAAAARPGGGASLLAARVRRAELRRQVRHLPAPQGEPLDLREARAAPEELDQHPADGDLVGAVPLDQQDAAAGSGNPAPGAGRLVLPGRRQQRHPQLRRAQCERVGGLSRRPPTRVPLDSRRAGGGAGACGCADRRGGGGRARSRRCGSRARASASSASSRAAGPIPPSSPAPSAEWELLSSRQLAPEPERARSAADYPCETSGLRRAIR